MEEGSGTASVGGHTIKVVPVAASSTARVVTTDQVAPRVILIPSLFHISTNLSKHVSVAFGQTEIWAFLVFGLFHLNFA